MTVRVRFAPSPTGGLHIGGVRTALYNYLFAKKNKGTFILRIEDTDQTRFVEGAENYIEESLKWLGLHPDESPSVGGEFEPYCQSERKEIYQKYAKQLVEEGKAYYAFDTDAELNEMREKVEHFVYNSLTRRQMRNSLTLPENEVKELLEKNTPHTIRIKLPAKDEVRFKDLVMGHLKEHTSHMDDKILLKSDGLPTYHLANVVDDHLMKVTHVIRGKEWINSAYLHVFLYQCLGWADSMPQFAHLPLILKSTGKGKLSKRDADKAGFPIFPLSWEDSTGFKEAGYLSEALLNFLAFLGWNPKSEQEIFSLDELTEAFSLEAVNKADVKFDIDKAKWFNEQYLKSKSEEELLGLLQSEMQKNPELAENLQDGKDILLIQLMKDRIIFPQQIWEDTTFIFSSPENYDEKTVRKKWKVDAVKALESFKNALPPFDKDWNADTIKQLMVEITEAQEIGLGKVMPTLRVSTTGQGSGPDLMTILTILGKEETEKRIQKALEVLEVS